MKKKVAFHFQIRQSFAFTSSLHQFQIALQISCNTNFKIFISCPKCSLNIHSNYTSLMQVKCCILWRSLKDKYLKAVLYTYKWIQVKQANRVRLGGCVKVEILAVTLYYGSCARYYCCRKRGKWTQMCYFLHLPMNLQYSQQNVN